MGNEVVARGGSRVGAVALAVEDSFGGDGAKYLPLNTCPPPAKGAASSSKSPILMLAAEAPLPLKLRPLQSRRLRRNSHLPPPCLCGGSVRGESQQAARDEEDACVGCGVGA